MHLLAWSEGQWLDGFFWLYWLLSLGAMLLFILASLFDTARSRIIFVMIIWPRHFFASLPWSGRIAVLLTLTYGFANLLYYFNAMGIGKLTFEFYDQHSVRYLLAFLLPFWLISALYFRYVFVRGSNSPTHVRT
jgi:hypothetical protein